MSPSVEIFHFSIFRFNFFIFVKLLIFGGFPQVFRFQCTIPPKDTESGYFSHKFCLGSPLDLLFFDKLVYQNCYGKGRNPVFRSSFISLF